MYTLLLVRHWITWIKLTRTQVNLDWALVWPPGVANKADALVYTEVLRRVRPPENEPLWRNNSICLHTAVRRSRGVNLRSRIASQQCEEQWKMSLILGNDQISNARVLYANDRLKQLGNVFLSGSNFLSLTTLVIIYNRTQAELKQGRWRLTSRILNCWKILSSGLKIIRLFD